MLPTKVVGGMFDQKREGNILTRSQQIETKFKKIKQGKRQYLFGSARQ